ncbi:hypothetical protein AVEN_205480-1 [Araneus ventricosus]|uniref:Uncharacterized protein n=1 Tax=Araneus ventricosus TaxID=182803 RepID=A0A4Y2CBL0_ARAVE|nr:hypothetical protein AVEN_205480-1 [Araneus ventricosus]
MVTVSLGIRQESTAALIAIAWVFEKGLNKYSSHCRSGGRIVVPHPVNSEEKSIKRPLVAEIRTARRRNSNMEGSRERKKAIHLPQNREELAQED